MFKIIIDLKAKKVRGEKGFTLIELLIVVAIIGILAAIAIPQFASYRIKSFNGNATADLRNIMTGEEAYYTDQSLYLAVAATAGPSAAFGTLPGVKLSKQVCAVTDADGALSMAQSYRGRSKHYSGDESYAVTTSTTITKTTGQTIGDYVIGC